MAAISTSFDPGIRDDPFILSTDHANGDANGHLRGRDYPTPPETLQPRIPPAFDLPGISLRAFFLGLTLGVTTFMTVYFIYTDQPIWRLPLFVSILSLFHFLEYQITATYNPTYATVTAFLLSSNGKAYNIAHSLAFLECLVRCTFVPDYSSAALVGLKVSNLLHLPILVTGLTMLLVGQATRTVAMAHAGSNFNHTVQMRKRQGHVLVTDGIYSYLRHPSYFGFFCWGLGSQAVLGNAICFIGYSIVLWRFFRHRITGKQHLNRITYKVERLILVFGRRREIIDFLLWR